MLTRALSKSNVRSQRAFRGHVLRSEASCANIAAPVWESYLAPARVEALWSTGTLIKAGKTLSYAEADVRTSDGRLVAHGTSTLMRLPGLGMKLGIPFWAE